MKLENQVSSLIPSQRLKELGVKQESLYYYDEVWSQKHGSGYNIFDKETISEEGELPVGAISAFTVAELGEMLPWDIVIARNDDKEWLVTFQADGLPESKSATFISNNEADARAKMLIYLIENKLITI